MSVHALLGLAAFNSLLLAVGVAALWTLRGWRCWRDAIQISGLAYMLGVALFGTILSIELALRVPFTLGAVLLTAAAIGVIAVALRGLAKRWRPASPGMNGRGIALVSVVFGLMVVVYFEALFRAGRLAGLSAWDAWAFWVPKAEAIYFFDGLDEQFFRELPNPTYPPLVPGLEATTFEFMGSPDVVTLHLQFWFFAFGFAAAVGGLLAPRVPPLLLWPVLLLVLAAPRVVGRNLDPQADFLLDYFFALAALLIALWLVEHEPWLLVAAVPFLAAAVLTKRDGQLLVACVIAAALVASWKQRRYAWPRLALVAALAVVAAVPWRFWFSSRDLAGELPSAGLLGLFDHLDRGWPALESVITTMFDYDLWLVVIPLVLVAVALAFLAGARILPTYALTLYLLVTAGITWVLWSFTELELPFVQDEGVNPVVRLSGSLVITSAAILPLLLDAAWQGGDVEKTEQ